jgi:hypothetical protein
MRSIATLALILACNVCLSAEVHKAIPDQFLGRWGGSAKSCADPSSDDLTLVVEPGRMLFWESSGKVLAVATDGPLKLALLFEFSGEGEKWLEAVEFQLSPDRNTLTTVTARQQLASRVRCPSVARK